MNRRSVFDPSSIFALRAAEQVDPRLLEERAAPPDPTVWEAEDADCDALLPTAVARDDGPTELVLLLVLSEFSHDSLVVALAPDERAKESPTEQEDDCDPRRGRSDDREDQRFKHHAPRETIAIITHEPLPFLSEMLSEPLDSAKLVLYPLHGQPIMSRLGTVFAVNTPRQPGHVYFSPSNSMCSVRKHLVQYLLRIDIGCSSVERCARCLN